MGFDGVVVIVNYVDASYGVHPDMKSHIGCLVTLGAGPIRSETDATNELVAMRDSYSEGDETMKGYSTRIFSALSMKEASSLYGEQLVRAASLEELELHRQAGLAVPGPADVHQMSDSIKDVPPAKEKA